MMGATRKIIPRPASQQFEIVLNSLTDAILTIDGANRFTFANAAAEQLIGSSFPILSRKKLEDIVPFDSPLMALVEQSRHKSAVITEYDVNIGNPKIGDLKIDVHVSRLIADPENLDDGSLLIQLQQRTIAQKINQQHTHRNSTRLVSGMAAMLAHEIKNPLSGIKGSAQILAQEVSDDDKPLTDLISEEVDRICNLVDRMEIFTDHRQIDKKEINIHKILEHVIKLAKNGFGKHVNFVEIYDPSLPETYGDKGALIQVFLNLVKNSCEAVPKKTGQVTITTSYRQGVRIAASDSEEILNLPLEICIIDNGSGIPEEIKADIFDPFVTTKSGGTGLGLPLVAKTIADHRGLIECESDAGKTTFKLLMPAVTKSGRGK